MSEGWPGAEGVSFARKVIDAEDWGASAVGNPTATSIAAASSMLR